MTDESPKTRVLFVCLGNICRSPLGEGIFRTLLADAGLSERFHVDSCGLGPWHAGSPPDDRAQRVALQHGVDISPQRARQVRDEDFLEFDHIIAMDRSVRDDLLDLAPPAARPRVRLMRAYDPEGGEDVPDPYHGGASGFDRVYTMIERCCRAFLRDVRQAGR